MSTISSEKQPPILGNTCLLFCPYCVVRMMAEKESRDRSWSSPTIKDLTEPSAKQKLKLLKLENPNPELHRKTKQRLWYFAIFVAPSFLCSSSFVLLTFSYGFLSKTSSPISGFLVATHSSLCFAETRVSFLFRMWVCFWFYISKFLVLLPKLC